MKLEIKRGVALGNGIDAYPGHVVEVNDIQARHLINRGSAVATDKPLAGKKENTPAATKSKAAANVKGVKTNA